MIYTVTLNPSIDYIIRVDELNVGGLNRIQEEQFLPGGKGINVSRILKRLGYENTALGFMGGFTGSFIQGKLNEEGVETAFTPVPDITRINVKLKAAEETEINGKGPAIEEKTAQEFLNKVSGFGPEDIVILSGSKPANLPADYYEQIIQRITETGCRFVIDTTGEELKQALQYRPLVVKPNHHELAELFGITLESEEDIFKYGQKLLEAGAEHAIISMAEKGAVLFTNEGIYRGSAPKGTVKNSVGSGDSMIAGFVGTYWKTRNPLEAFRISLACGSATAFEEDLATKEQIERLLPEINVQEMERESTK